MRREHSDGWQDREVCFYWHTMASRFTIESISRTSIYFHATSTYFLDTSIFSIKY